MYPTKFLGLATKAFFRPQSSGSVAPTIRAFSQTPFSSYPRVGSQDKDSIDTEATEYSKSGTDDGAARQEEAAFDPNITRSEKEKDVAGKGTGTAGNPLDVSPANPEVSKPRGEDEGGAEKSDATPKQSGGKGTGGGSRKKVQ